MSWQILIGLSIILYSVNSLLHRTVLKDKSSNAHAQAIAFTGLTGVFSTIVLLFRGGFQLFPSANQIPLFILVAFLSALGMLFTFKGFKSIDASEHTILLTSSRIWLILGAIFFLKESFSLARLLGAGTIVLGVVIAEWKKDKLKINKGALYVLLAAFFFAISETLSFYILRNFDVFSFMVYASLLVTLILIIVKPKIIKKLQFYLKPKYALYIIITSFNDGVANILAFLAYQIGRNALQIGPLGATGTLVTVILGIIILKERNNMLQKILGSILAVLGTILLL